MNANICEKCSNWWEHFRLDRNEKKALLYVGCCLEQLQNNDVYKYTEISESKYELVRTAMNDKDYCGMKNDEFENVVDIVKDEYKELKKSIFDMDTPIECEYFAEHKIEEWNNGR